MKNPAHPQASRGLLWLMLSIPMWTMPVWANDKTVEQPSRGRVTVEVPEGA